MEYDHLPPLTEVAEEVETLKLSVVHLRECVDGS